MAGPGNRSDKPEALDSDAPATGEAPVEPLGRSAAAGTLWLTAAQWLMRLTGLITVAVLTRLLTPEDFGVVAAAMTVTPFILLLADLGLSTYVIQVKHADQRLLSTAFWYSLSMAIALMTAMAVFAPVIAVMFNLPGAAPVLRGCSLAAGFIVLCSVPAALLRREMRFRELSLQWLVSAVIAQVVAVVLAFHGAGAWALVSQLVVAEAISCILVWKAARWRPKFQFSKSEFFDMAKFGNKVITVDLIVAMRPAAEAAIISTVLGPAALGFLSIAQRLVQVTQDLGGKALVPVSTVVFAKVRESPQRLQSAYVKALGIAYAAVSPLMTVVVVGGTLVVPLLFGQGWDQSVPVAQALGLAAILTLGAIIDQRLYYGIGKPGRWLIYAACIGALEITVTALVARHGLNWVAIGFVTVAFVATVVRWVLVGRLLDSRSRTLAMVFAAASVAVAGSAGAGLLVLTVTGRWAPAWSLTAVILTVGLVHIGIVRVVSPEVYRTVRSLVHRTSRADESS